MIKQEANQAMARIIKHQKENGLKPMLVDLLALYYQFLDNETIKDILGDDDAAQLNWTPQFKIAWDEKYTYDLSGDISMLDKQTRLDNIEQGTQILTQMAPQLGAQINYVPVAEQVIDPLGLPKNILVPAPPPPPQAPQGPQGQPAPQGQPNTGAAANNATMTAPAPTAAMPQGPTSSGPQEALTPEQIQMMPQIAQLLDTDPDTLMAKVQDGTIPGGFATLEHISQHPELVKKFKTSLIRATAAQNNAQ